LQKKSTGLFSVVVGYYDRFEKKEERVRRRASVDTCDKGGKGSGDGVMTKCFEERKGEMLKEQVSK
jgi:hypothetical protein